MEKTELLACPHCGNSAIVVEICGGHFYKVKCRNIMECGAETERFDDEEEADSAWNRRTPSPGNKPLTVEELREMDGEPVYIAGLNAWVLVSMDIGSPVFVFRDGGRVTAADCSEVDYIAYRRPPEED